MYTEINGVALAIIAKAGTQSFTEAANAQWYINNEQALDLKVRIFFIRNPFDRLESCYSFFCQLQSEGSTQDIIPVECLATWEVFIDYILLNSDVHWNQQTGSLLFNGKLTPTHIFKFEDVDKWWPVYFNTRLPHNNKAARKVVGGYKEKELRSFYATDLKVWDSAKAYNNDGKEDGRWPLP